MSSHGNKGNPVVDDETFMEMFEAMGTSQMSRQLGIAERAIYSRRRRLEAEYNVQLFPPRQGFQAIEPERTARREYEVEDGSVIVFSDAHYWPQTIPTIHAAIVDVAKKIKPKMIVANGDIFDGARMSRHARIGWESTPEPHEEVWACQARLAEIEAAAPKATKVWTLGNHDARFETYVANNAPEMAKVHGVHLRDHFPAWETAWSAWINGEVCIKHRWHGGIHAAWNNVLKSGVTFVSGHTHQMNIRPFNDYNGTRYGIECGTASEPNGPQYMAYTEDNPKNWISGAMVLSFRRGILMDPEPIRRIDHGLYSFRGDLHEVSLEEKKTRKKRAKK